MVGEHVGNGSNRVCDELAFEPRLPDRVTAMRSFLTAAIIATFAVLGVTQKPSGTDDPARDTVSYRMQFLHSDCF